MKKTAKILFALILVLTVCAGALALADWQEDIEGYWTNIEERLVLDICDKSIKLQGPGGMPILNGKILFCLTLSEEENRYLLTVRTDTGIVMLRVYAHEYVTSEPLNEEGPYVPSNVQYHRVLELTVGIKGEEPDYTLYDEEPSPAPYYHEIPAAFKPVIYLYPEEETEVSVKLSLNGALTCTYPAYENGWTVTALPDGTLTDTRGRQHDYLYWEGKVDYTPDFTRGWCVKGDELVPFFEKTLSELGLIDSEANEFIVYWLPILQENAYNLISFDASSYCENAVLTASPAPDTVIRVYMTVNPLDAPVEIKAPELPAAPERNGFTLVEWGGSIIK